MTSVGLSVCLDGWMDGFTSLGRASFGIATPTNHHSSDVTVRCFSFIQIYHNIYIYIYVIHIYIYRYIYIYIHIYIQGLHIESYVHCLIWVNVKEIGTGIARGITLASPWCLKVMLTGGDDQSLGEANPKVSNG
jgi:hypothetical protein